MRTNQNPKNWSSGIVNQKFEKKIADYRKTSKTKAEITSKNKPERNAHTNSAIWRPIWLETKRLQKITHTRLIYTAMKLKTCLPSQKSRFDLHLKSHAVYEITYCVCIFY